MLYLIQDECVSSRFYYIFRVLGLETGRLVCTRKGDKTTPIYHGRYVPIHSEHA